MPIESLVLLYGITESFAKRVRACLVAVHMCWWNNAEELEIELSLQGVHAKLLNANIKCGARYTSAMGPWGYWLPSL